MLRKVLFLAALSALCLSGCRQHIIVGGIPRVKEFTKIVSLSPSTTELEGATFKTGSLVGRTAQCNYPLTILPTPIVAGVKPDYEKIASIKPDLILYDKSLYGPADVAKIRQLCPNIFVLSADNLKSFEYQAAELANIVGGETFMSDYFDKIHAQIQEAMTHKLKVNPTLALIMPGLGSEHMIDGVDSFQADVIKAAQGRPVGPAGDKFVPLQPEMLVKWDPDYIVTCGPPDSFVKDPRFANLKAVKERHVYGINQDVALRRGGRVDKFIEDLSKILSGSLNAS